MKRKRSALAVENYWPGYVDALTNIVLNLLFLVAIFVIGVTALGIVASRHPMPSATSYDDSSVDKIKKEVKLIKTDVKTNNTSEMYKIVVSKTHEPIEISSVNKGVTIENFETRDDKIQVELNFEPMALDISNEHKEAIISKLRPYVKKSNGEISIRAVTNTDNPILRRTSYLRVIKVRDLLLEEGVSQGRFKLHINNGPTSHSGGQKIYIMIKGEEQ